MTAKLHFPNMRLTTLVARSGGISYSTAMENARQRIETLRAEGDKILETVVGEINAILDAKAAAHDLTEAEMSALLLRADQIVTLSETFGYETLGTVSRSLCDMVDGLMRSGHHDVAPVRVHVQAMDMVMPWSAPLSEAEFDLVLGELAKVRRKFDIKPIDSNDSFAALAH